MREKINKGLAALRTMPYWYQGSVGFLGLSLVLTVIAMILSLFSVNLFLLTVDGGILTFEEWVIANGLVPLAHGVVMAVGGVFYVLIASRRYDFDGTLKAGLLLILPCISFQYITSYAVFAALSTGYLIILSWALSPGWKTFVRILFVSVAATIIQAALSYIKMPNYPLLDQKMISYGIIFNLDLWQLSLGVIMVDYAISKKQKEV